MRNGSTNRCQCHAPHEKRSLLRAHCGRFGRFDPCLVAEDRALAPSATAVEVNGG
jgi:hypothetical protein